MSVILAGGSGFVGRHLAKVLVRNGFLVTCVSRVPRNVMDVIDPTHFHDIISWSQLTEMGLPICDAVINLAGANIMRFSRRWTEEYKREVVSSRVETTRHLTRLIQSSKKKPKVFATASGVGFYAPNSTYHYDEYNAGGSGDFLGELTTAWEDASRLPADSGVRVVNIRSGLVLGRDGGIIKNLYWPFFFGLGGPVGNGRQPFPWIHVEDLAHLYLFMLENKRCEGIYNGVSPQMITNADFTRAFAKAMHRPAVIPTPPFLLNAGLGEERAAMILQGQIVHPKRALDAGYEFIYPEINEACEEIVAPVRLDEE